MPNCAVPSILRFFSIGSIGLAVLAPTMLIAQGTSATVSGVIADPTGAKIAAATVTFTNSSTGVATKVLTNGDGLYRINGLQPGLYNSTVTMEGFKTVVRQGIDLHLEDQVALDYTLDIGASNRKRDGQQRKPISWRVCRRPSAR